MPITFRRKDYKTKEITEEVKYVGRVLKLDRDTSYQIMSDIWGAADEALVLEDDGRVCRIVYNVYDMCAPDPKSEATVDATPETREAARQFYIKIAFERMKEQAEIAAARVEKGCIAKVVSGKTAKGAVGKVIAAITGSYGMGYRAIQMQKYGIATSDKTFKKALPSGKVVDAHEDVVWVWAKNVQRVDITKVDEAAILKEVTEAYDRFPKV